MDREAIRDQFRQENPEITDRVLDDTQLNAWLLIGNLEFATKARIITSENTITTTIGEDSYSLTTEIDSFFDIDEFPGGGVAFNGKRIEHTTRSRLDSRRSAWRSYADGTPRSYYRFNEFLKLDRGPETAHDVTVDAILKPDSLNDDGKTPFNQLTYLEPFHYGLVLYLTMRAKGKEGKVEEFTKAIMQYESYIKWTKKEVQGGKISKIQITPSEHFPDSMYR